MLPRPLGLTFLAMLASPLRLVAFRPLPRTILAPGRLFSSSANSYDAAAPVYLDLQQGQRNASLAAGDHLVSALSGEGDVSVKVLRNTETVRELARRQGLTELTADALGRAMSATQLLASGLKDGMTVQLAFAGSGALEGMLCIGEADGGGRGYVGKPELNLPRKAGRDGRMRPDVAAAIGPGELRVVRNAPDFKEPYSGITEIRTGTVAEDVAVYLSESEQRKTAIGAGVAFHEAESGEGSTGEGGGKLLERLAASGGFLVELLPGCSAAAAEQVEQNVYRLVARSESPATFLAAGTSPEQLAEELMAGLGKPRQLLMSEVCFRCRCNRSRLSNALRMLPAEDLDDIVAKGEDVEAKCELCGARYTMTVPEVQRDVMEQKQ